MEREKCINNKAVLHHNPYRRSIMKLIVALALSLALGQTAAFAQVVSPTPAAPVAAKTVVKADKKAKKAKKAKAVKATPAAAPTAAKK
jgi:hypothetical protein